MNQFIKNSFSPIQLISLGYVVVILIGAVMLMLPVSSTTSTSQNFLDALFTSTSAVSTTGLIVVDTGSYYSLFGEIVILILIQIGGLGYMVLLVLITLLFRNKLSITGKKYLRESVSRLSNIDMIKFIKLTVIFTIAFEGIGTILYFVVLRNHFGIGEALYISSFHSVSAFCTAGFSLFSNSLSDYGFNWLININTFILAIGGSIGFFVIYDIFNYLQKSIKREPIKRLSVQSKIVLITSTTLFIVGAVTIFLLEGDKFATNYFDKILYSLFQSITASTTVGFNTVDVGLLTNGSLFIIIILMFIGGSPGSTAGGIKTTNLIIFSKFSINALSERKHVFLFKRTINSNLFQRSAAQIFIAVISIAIFTFILSVSEQNDFIKIFFEAVSAFGTIGLSTGITAELSSIGKLSIIALMLIGRIGPLVIGLSLIPKAKNNNYLYPEEEILIS
jgi:trk system potassium uptake protein TrkH